MKQVYVSLPDMIIDFLKRDAGRMGVSMSEHVRQIVFAHYLNPRVNEMLPRSPMEIEADLNRAIDELVEQNKRMNGAKP